LERKVANNKRFFTIFVLQKIQNKMNKIVLFRAAQVMMCAIAFSFCMNSCEKNEVDNQDDANSLSIPVDTNGVSFTIKPLLNWNSSEADVDEYIARNYPGLEISELSYDSSTGYWTKYYAKKDLKISCVCKDEQGSGYQMMNFYFSGSREISKVLSELNRAGLKYHGLLYYELYPYELDYLYLSADEKLEVQVYVINDESDPFWGITFQPLDKEDMNYLINDTTLSINAFSGVDSCTVVPLLDWDATVDDVREYMADNYPDWAVEENGELQPDTTYIIDLWYVEYIKDSIQMVYYFSDIEGKNYFEYQYINSISDDIKPLQSELTRNGYVFKGRMPRIPQNVNSAYFYVSQDSKNIVGAVSSSDFGGCQLLEIRKYGEKYLE
jgi:hypothetical protein